MTSRVIYRRRSNRRFLTVSKAAAWLFGAACIALPFGVALAGNLAGIK